mgnify:CR=1 FL=1
MTDDRGPIVAFIVAQVLFLIVVSGVLATSVPGEPPSDHHDSPTNDDDNDSDQTVWL